MATFGLMLLLWANVPSMVFGPALTPDPTAVAFVGLFILIITGTIDRDDVLSEKSAWDIASVLVLVFVFSHYLFASTTAHVSAMMLAFLTVGAQLIPAEYVVPFMLMMTAGSAIMMTLTHYATGTSPIIFGSGFVTMGNWWRVGFVMCVVELLIFALVGGAWWKVLGYW